MSCRRIRAGVASCVGRQSCRTLDPALRPGSHSQRLRDCRVFQGDADVQPIHDLHSMSPTRGYDWKEQPEVPLHPSNNTFFLVS